MFLQLCVVVVVNDVLMTMHVVDIFVVVCAAVCNDVFMALLVVKNVNLRLLNTVDFVVVEKCCYHGPSCCYWSHYI